ncbi:MAG: ATP-dependent RNA helicase HrpA, partial [Planctomycetota bacterium]|nr:ATP-dependent RNA helicase HrpA [Planctomycetota bacterium]
MAYEPKDRSNDSGPVRRVPTPSFSQNLPILHRREEIAKAIREHQVCIICGETGSGKTTQLPQICLALGRGTRGLIGHTQPRRLAARSVAQRIADELNVPLGSAVGFKVRFGDQTSAQTSIKLMTDGILLAETQGDRDLSRYDTIIIDEAHERSLNIDFLLGYLKQLLPRRPDLKVIVTSATIDPQRLSDHFGGPSVAPVLEVSGRTYPVEVRYAPVGDDGDDFEEVEDRAVVDAVGDLLSPRLPEGDILVFLPGEREIRNAATALRRGLPKADLDILPLYSRLSNSEQDRIFRTGDRRRVILATNVAETSLTVPGIRYVVDTGLSRQSRYDPRTRVQRLPIAAISQASAQQRSGRCGRVAAGICIRLYGKEQFESWPKFTTPEILRTNLASVILTMKGLNLGPIEEFPFLERPEPAMIADGYATLHELGALTTPDASGELTPIGQRLARLPVDPRVGRMIIASEEEEARGNPCLEEVLVLASALSIQDPRERPMSRQRDADIAHLSFYHEHSDFMVLLNIWDQFQHAAATLTHGPLFQWCRERFLSFNRMREWTETWRQLRDMARDRDDEDESQLLVKSGKHLYDSIHRALLTGLLSNLCCRDELAGETVYRGSRGNRASIFPGSVLFKKGPRWLMAAELVQTTRLYARTCAKIETQWVEELAAHVMTRTVSDPHFDKDLGDAAAWERATLAGAVIVPRRKVRLHTHDPAQSRSVFIAHALIRGDYRGEAPFRGHNALALQKAQDAVAKLRRHDVLRDESELAAFFQERLPASVVGRESFDQFLASLNGDQRCLFLSEQDFIGPQHQPRLVSGDFPDELVAGDLIAKLEYAFSPGKDDDGLTLVIPLLELDQLDPTRCEWLVPGFLPDLIAAMVKGLPKAVRAALEAAASGDAAKVARDAAAVLTFGEGSLSAALCEAMQVLYGQEVQLKAWAAADINDHLRMRFDVVDHSGRSLAQGRDLPELRTRLAARLERARASAARSKYRQEGLTAWTFGQLQDSIDLDGVLSFTAIIDRGQSISLTLIERPGEAAANTYLGIRRLFALACESELDARIRALPRWEEMVRLFGSLGSESELRDAICCIACERVFMFNQAPIRESAMFEARRDEQWGRLGQSVIEVGAAIARVLEARFKVAGRFAGGTPRLWAASVADMREQAAYLMPKGFLKLITWEHLRD